MFGLGKLLYIMVLGLNAILVLSEDRFLIRIGLTSSNQFQQYGEPSVGSQIMKLISAIRMVMRFPLICVNIVIILYEIAWG